MRRPFRMKRLIAISVVIVSIIVSLSLVGTSYKQVGVNQYALKRNFITNEVDSVVYESGMYFIGFWCDFIIFPSTWTTIAFTPSGDANDVPINVQTKNGLLVSVDVSFQFRLRKIDLIQLFSDYGTAYSDYIENVARSALRAVIGTHTAEELYVNRTAVNNAMKDALTEALDATVQIGDFQLRTIDFPESFEEAVEQYEVWRIEVEIAALEQQAELIRQETLTLIEIYTANRTVIEYQGIVDALDIMRQELNMTNEELLTYLWIQTIYVHDQAYLFIGLQDAPILIPINGTSS